MAKIKPVKTFFPLVLFLAALGISFSAFANAEKEAAEREEILTVRGLFSDHIYELAVDEAKRFLARRSEGRFVDEVHYILAASLFRLGEHEASLAEFELIGKNYPESPLAEEAMFFKAAALFNLGRFEEANEANELLLIRFPKTKHKKEAQIRKIKLLYELERHYQVIKTFELYRDLGLFTEKDEKVLNEMRVYHAFSLEAVGRKTEAKRLIRKLLAEAPTEKEKVLLDLRLILLDQNPDKPGESHALLRKIKDYYQQEESRELIDREAAVVFFRWNQSDPDANPGYRKETIAFLEKRRSSSAASEDERFMLAWFYLREGEKDKASEIFFALRNDNPEFASRKGVSRYLAEIYEERGDRRTVSLLLEESLKNEKKPGERNRIILKLAEFFLNENRPDKALEHLKKADYPPGAAPSRYHFLLAGAHFVREEFNEAAEHYLEIPENAEEYPLIFNEFLISLSQSGRTGEFVEFFVKSADLIPPDRRPEAYRVKLEFYLERGMCERILTEAQGFEAVGDGFQNSSEFLKHLGDCFLKKNDETKAAAQYRKAFDLPGNGSNGEKLVLADRLSGIYLKNKNFKELTQIYTRSIPMIEDPLLRTRSELFLGKIWDRELDNGREAIKWYSEVHLKQDYEENFEASYLLGEVYVNQNQLKSALFVLKAASEKLPKSSAWFAIVNHRIAQIHHNREQLKSALKYYRLAASKKVDSPERKDSLSQISLIKKYLKSTAK